MIIYLLKLIFSLGLFLWLMMSGEIQFHSFRQLVQHKFYLFMVIATQGVLFLVAADRWYVLTHAVGLQIPYLRLLKYFTMGEFFSLFILGAMGGDLSRMIFLGSSAPQRRLAAVLTVLIDKAMTLLVLCGIGLTAMFFYQPLFEMSPWGSLLKLFLVGVVLGSAILILFLYLAPFERVFVTTLGPVFSQIISWREKLHRIPRKALLKTLLLNLVAQFILILNIVFCAFALGIFHVPISVFLLVVPLGTIALALPFSVAGLGIGQLAYAHLFRLCGVNEEAFGGNLSTLHIAAWTLFALLGGVLFTISRSPKP